MYVYVCTVVHVRTVLYYYTTYLPGYVMYIFDMCLVMYLFLILKYLPVPVCTPRPGTVDM